MRLPKLSQLQARFAACLAASIALVAVYYTLSSPRFAYAAELDIAKLGLIEGAEDHIWKGLRDSEQTQSFLNLEEDREDDEPLREEKGDLFWMRLTEETRKDNEGGERSVLRRATPSVTASALPGSNSAINLNIEAGQKQNWTVSNITSWLPKTPLPAGLPSALGSANTSSLYSRENGTTQVFISINTCLQPLWNGTGPQAESPPQLSITVTAPSYDQSITLDQGFANVTFNATSFIDITVEAPSLDKNFEGGWNYELAASVDNYYHNVDLNPDPPLYWVDSDTTAALLVTANLTSEKLSSRVYQQWMNSTNPFIVYVQNSEYANVIDGVRNSFCGLQNSPIEFTANPQDPQGITSKVQMGMINRSTQPQQQFYVEGLNGSASYEAVLAMQGNSSARGAGIVGGGGWVSQARTLTTKSGEYSDLRWNLNKADDVDRRKLRSFVQSDLLFRGSLCSPKQSQHRAISSAATGTLRWVRSLVVSELHLLSSIDALQHDLDCAILSSQELRRLRCSIQAVVVRGNNSPVR